jgi:hypothetical protein
MDRRAFLKTAVATAFASTAFAMTPVIYQPKFSEGCACLACGNQTVVMGKGKGKCFTCGAEFELRGAMSRDEIIAEALKTEEGRTALAQAMLEPIAREFERAGVGTKLLFDKSTWPALPDHIIVEI